MDRQTDDGRTNGACDNNRYFFLKKEKSIKSNLRQIIYELLSKCAAVFSWNLKYSAKLIIIVFTKKVILKRNQLLLESKFTSIAQFKTIFSAGIHQVNSNSLLDKLTFLKKFFLNVIPLPMPPPPPC